MTSIQALHEAIHLFHEEADIDTAFDGVRLWRMGDLARANGVERWKRAPVGTGANARFVELSLRAKGLQIYSRRGNLAAGGNGTIMTTAVLRHIHADDFVIVLDTRFETARRLEDGAIEVTHPNDDSALSAFRGDEIRAANFNDALQVGHDVIFPLLFGPAR